MTATVGRGESATSVVDVRRLSGQLLALALLCFGVPAAIELRAQTDRVSAWWSTPLVVLVVLSFGLALSGWERWGARVLWVAGLVGSVTVPFAVAGKLGAPTFMGVLSPVVIGGCVLISRRPVVSLAGVVALLVPAGLARRALLPEPPKDTVQQVLALLAIWAVSLALLRLLEHAQHRVEGVQDAAVEEFVAARAAEATVRAEQAWDAYLHDEVVAVLAVLAEGDTAEAREQAERVLAEPWDLGGGSVPTPWIGAGSLDSVMRHRPGAETVIDIDPGTGALPEEVRRAVLEAVSEALRNVDRHAYGPGGEGPARLELSLDASRVRAVVSDEGRGFDPRHVADSRLGIAVSIQARMDAAGGWARVESAPGRGTRVELGWDRPVVDVRR